MPIFIGWLVGLVLGAMLAGASMLALALPLPTFLGPFGLPVSLPIVAVLVLLVLVYVAAYALATRSLTPLLPPVTLPLTFPVPVPAGVSVPLPPTVGELVARGVAIGTTAALNASFLALVPLQGPVLSTWAFITVSLAIVTPVSRNRIYHGFLGWTGWLLPVSYVATAVGLLLFLVNAPFALAFGGLAAFRIDWSTGVIESSGGIVGMPFIPPTFGGFSLGNFNFLRLPGLQTGFLVNGLSSHETGHTLNTAALGGVVLWINAVDENVRPFRRLNIAYGELTAESHAQVLPPPPPPAVGRAAFFVRSWG